MLKTREYRKLVLMMAFVWGIGLLLAACGSNSSSTNEPMNHPGDNYLGSVLVTVDPNNGGKLDFSPVNANQTNTVDSNSTFYVSSSGVVWTAGTYTLTGNVKLKWKGSKRIEDVRIGIFSTDSVGGTATVNNKDTCGSYGNLSAAIAAGCETGYVYTGDVTGDGPETEFEANTTMGQRWSRVYRLICPDCGTITANWSFTENVTKNQKYFLQAHLFGNEAGRYAMDDPRYDANVATFKAKAYKMNLASGEMDTTQPITQAQVGEWFFVHVWADAPGANRATGWPPCAEGSGDTTCSITGGSMTANDYYFVEDAPNMASFAAKPAACASWAGADNTGFIYSSNVSYRLRWDPAVVQTNGTDTTVVPRPGITSSGVNGFNTRGGVGTAVVTVKDSDPADIYTLDATFISSNFTNRTAVTFSGTYSIPTTCPYLGDGIDNYPVAQYKQGDVDAGRIAFKALNVAGDGTRFDISPGGGTVFNAANGRGGTTYVAGNNKATQKSTNYPKWANNVSQGEGNTLKGAYNEAIGWICVIP